MGPPQGGCPGPPPHGQFPVGALFGMTDSLGAGPRCSGSSSPSDLRNGRVCACLFVMRSGHGSKRDPKDLLAAPHHDHFGIAGPEAGVCFEFGDDLEGVLLRSVVIGEVRSSLVIEYAGAFGDKKVVTHGLIARSPASASPVINHGILVFKA